jgi:4'-phosphopantetheinyl transferase
MTQTDIDLWIWSLDMGPDRIAALSAFLSPDEHARAERFVHPHHARRYIAGRGRLREILGNLAGQDPANVDFDYNPQGKPYLTTGPVFNLSNSGDWAALAMTDTARLGIDIELLRPVEDDVARRFFSPAEYADLSALPAAQWRDGFFRCWTRKEAIIKACGLGLSMPLDAFEVTLKPGQPAKLNKFQDEESTEKDWTLVHLDIQADLIGAIAVQAPLPTIRINLREGQMRSAPA